MADFNENERSESHQRRNGRNGYQQGNSSRSRDGQRGNGRGDNRRSENNRNQPRGDRRENRGDRFNRDGDRFNPRNERGDRSDRSYRGDRNDRNERVDRFNRNGRDDRNGRGGRSGNRDGNGPRRHSQRGGVDRDGVSRAQHSGPQRSGYREERINKRMNEPRIPEDINPKDLDPMVRQELRSLSKDNADMVAKHLIMATLLLDDQPEQALKHARAAKDRAGRVAVARETCGIVAYHNGEWKEAIAELRAARRMSGGPGLLAVLADCERALGRPEKALEVAAEFADAELDPETAVELAIVLAGAHEELGNNNAALELLTEHLEDPEAPEHSRLRVTYAHADLLERMGRTAEARFAFQQALELDTEDVLDAQARLDKLNEAEA